MVRPHQRQPRGNANEEVKKTQRSVPKSTANVGPLQFQFPIDVQRTLNHRWQKDKDKNLSSSEDGHEKTE
jgi:hypothetical protein